MVKIYSGCYLHDPIMTYRFELIGYPIEGKILCSELVYPLSTMYLHPWQTINPWVSRNIYDVKYYYKELRVIKDFFFVSIKHPVYIGFMVLKTHVVFTNAL